MQFREVRARFVNLCKFRTSKVHLVWILMSEQEEVNLKDEIVEVRFQNKCIFGTDIQIPSTLSFPETRPVVIGRDFAEKMSHRLFFYFFNEMTEMSKNLETEKHATIKIQKIFRGHVHKTKCYPFSNFCLDFFFLNFQLAYNGI